MLKWRIKAHEVTVIGRAEPSGEEMSALERQRRGQPCSTVAPAAPAPGSEAAGQQQVRRRSSWGRSTTLMFHLASLPLCVKTDFSFTSAFLISDQAVASAFYPGCDCTASVVNCFFQYDLSAPEATVMCRSSLWGALLHHRRLEQRQFQTGRVFGIGFQF